MKRQNKDYQKIATVQLTLHDGTLHTVAINGILKEYGAFIDISNHIKNNSEGFLLRIEDTARIAMLNLTNVSPYLLLFFDEELLFKGTSYSIKGGSGNYTIQTQYKNILFLRMPHNLKLNPIFKDFIYPRHVYFETFRVFCKSRQCEVYAPISRNVINTIIKYHYFTMC